jgi:hypothetical protein
LRNLDLRRQPVYCVHQSGSPPAGPPSGLLDCTSGHQLPRQPWRSSEGPALPSRLVRHPWGREAHHGPARGLAGPAGLGGRAGASRVGVLGGLLPCRPGRSGGTRDDRRRPGHRGSRVHGRAGVDGRCGLHGHTPMGPWGQVDVCPGLATCVSERRKMLLCLNGEKTQGHAISEGVTLSERRKIQEKRRRVIWTSGGEMFYSRRT